MVKTLIINLNVRISLDDDADLQDIIENVEISMHDTTGKAEIDEARILNYNEEVA